MTDRELDALIAEKVMGWRDIATDGVSVYGHLPPGTEPHLNVTRAGNGFYHIKRYSTSIADAWEVVERMRELSFVLTLSWQSRNSEWCAHWFYPADRTHKAAFHKSAPRAICLAALKTIGVDVDLNTSKKQSNA